MSQIMRKLFFRSFMRFHFDAFSTASVRFLHITAKSVTKIVSFIDVIKIPEHFVMPYKARQPKGEKIHLAG